MDPAKLTEKSRVAVQAAQQLAVARGHQPTDAEHLALALVQQPEGLVPRLLEKMHRPPATVGKVIDDLLARKPSVGGPGSNPAAAGISQALSQTLEKALTAATAMGDDFVSVEHLVLGLLGLESSHAVRKAFNDLGIDESSWKQAVKDLRGNQKVTTDNPEGTFEALAKYGQDLVEAARAGKLDPVIGRDEEIRRTIRILSRKTKNNPVLIGEPGVGKTAIVEGLAQRIVRGDVPDDLKDKTVFSLDMGSAHRRRQVPRRVRGTPEGRAQRGEGRRGPDPALHRRAAHDRRRRQEPTARWTRATS